MKWEYAVLDLYLSTVTTIQNQLVCLGQDGWELVSVDNGKHYFKRQLAERYYTSEAEAKKHE